MAIGGQATSRLGVELGHLKFYEGAVTTKEDLYPSDYKIRFPEEATSSVNIELCLNNLFFRDRDQKFQLLVRYYNPDGSLAWEDHHDEVLPSGDEYFYETTGRFEGKWALGTYRVEILIDGVPFTEGSFIIV